jgi:hypothetical protein
MREELAIGGEIIGLGAGGHSDGGIGTRGGTGFGRRGGRGGGSGVGRVGTHDRYQYGEWIPTCQGVCEDFDWIRKTLGGKGLRCG